MFSRVLSTLHLLLQVTITITPDVGSIISPFSRAEMETQRGGVTVPKTELNIRMSQHRPGGQALAHSRFKAGAGFRFPRR